MPPRDTSEIRIWRHFHWSAFVLMATNVTRWESRYNFTSSASSIFLVHDLCCDKYISRTYLKVSRLSIEFLGEVLTFSEREYELRKLPLNSSFCAVTADPESRWPHGKKKTPIPAVSHRDGVPGNGIIHSLVHRRQNIAIDSTKVIDFRLKARRRRNASEVSGETLDGYAVICNKSDEFQISPAALPEI